MRRDTVGGPEFEPTDDAGLAEWREACQKDPVFHREMGEMIARLDALQERMEVVYLALKKLNAHHKHEHHQDDPAMPMDSDVAAGFLAYDNRPRHWWASALKAVEGAS